MSTRVQPVVAARPRGLVACAACAMHDFCHGFGDAPWEDDPGVTRVRLAPGEALFRPGDSHAAIYAVRAGFLKTNAVLPDGERRVIGFHLMGELLGLAAIGARVHRTEAVALNGCEVCRIPLARAEAMMAANEPLAARMRAALAEQIARSEDHIVALGSHSARQRVAGFLLDISRRWAARGYSPHRFDLCLTRKEIGSYLGLTFETVSRTLSALAAESVIAVAGREIRILDLAALEANEAQRS